ncbi:MAG: hypothetical protein K5683_11805 [Prevotella sp.]|nr:hypothetical protein [Prevotella sp.]
MTDIALTPDLDMMVADGDLVTEENLKQAQQLLLVTNKGEWKQHPTAGVGVANYLETASAGELSREIREQFSRDGMKVSSVKISGTTLEVEATWK